jgi:phosphoglycolate phosphatase-like HAD superfamily hydrolase
MRTVALDLDDTLIDTYGVLMGWAARQGLVEATDGRWEPLVGGYSSLPHGVTDGFHCVEADLRLQANPGALEACEALVADGFRLVVVTARAPHLAAQSSALVEVRFPGLFSDVICNGFASKADTLLRIGADLFVDDSPGQVRFAGAAGIPAVLFGELPWNAGVPSTMRATDWPEAMGHHARLCGARAPA